MARRRDDPLYAEKQAKMWFERSAALASTAGSFVNISQGYTMYRYLIIVKPILY